MFGLGWQEFLILLILVVPIIVVVVLARRGNIVPVAARSTASAGVEVFSSAASRARWTIGLLIAGICLDVVALVSGVFQASLVERVLSGATITPAEAAANDSRQQLIGVLQILLYVVTAVVFLLWVSRSYRNLSALTTLSRMYSPGWAVGSFFVPFLNLVRPFQIIRELWHLSDADPTVAALRAKGRKLPTPSAVGWWWGISLVSGFLGQAALRAALRMNTPQDILNATYISLATDVASIGAAALAISVVKAVDLKQAVRHSRLVSLSEAGRTDAEQRA